MTLHSDPTFSTPSAAVSEARLALAAALASRLTLRVQLAIAEAAALLDDVFPPYEPLAMVPATGDASATLKRAMSALAAPTASVEEALRCAAAARALSPAVT